MSFPESKGRSPFSPNQPVDLEYFTGRTQELTRIERELHQVSHGDSRALFLQGEYGIGKSSLAKSVVKIAEERYSLPFLYVPLGSMRNLEDLYVLLSEQVVRLLHRSNTEKYRDWVGQYINKVSILGSVELNLEALRRSAPKNYLGVLELVGRTTASLEAPGLGIILDEINGIASNLDFAHFLKSLVDSNALAEEPNPLLLLLCGTEERRAQLLNNHPPLERVFAVVDVKPLSEPEVKAFYTKAFASINYAIEPEVLEQLAYYVQGQPKIMQLMGEELYWASQSQTITTVELGAALQSAVEEIGRRYVDTQVYSTIRSERYRNILAALAQLPHQGLQQPIVKKELAEYLEADEQKVLNNFLQKMKKLNVLRPGDGTGEYYYTSRMLGAYIGLTASELGSR